jgi:hypothetical protein
VSAFALDAAVYLVGIMRHLFVVRAEKSMVLAAPDEQCRCGFQ